MLTYDDMERLLTTEELDELEQLLAGFVAPLRIVTEQDLRAASRELLGFDLPDTPCCPDHQTPFDFLYALHFKESRRTRVRETNLLGVAARGSYKTLVCGVSEALGACDERGENIAHIGAIQAQSQRCYEYVQTFLQKPLLASLVVGQPTMKETRTASGGKVEVLWATANQLNSPHVPTVRFDEIELAKPHVAQEALGILSDAPGVTPSIAHISSLKFPHGTVQKMIDSAAKDGRAVYTWCYKEVCEPCPDDRSGTTPATAYIDRQTLDALSADDWRAMPEGERDAYEPHEVFDGCLSCPLLASCRAGLKRATGNQSIDSFILKFRAASPSFWILQFESRQAQVEGAVLSGFRPTGTLRTHVRSLDELGPLDLARGPVWIALDPGRHHPAVGLWQHVERPTGRLAELVHPGAIVLYDEVHDYGADSNLQLPALAERIANMLGRNGITVKRRKTCEVCHSAHILPPSFELPIACDPASSQQGDLGLSTLKWWKHHGWDVEIPRMRITDRLELLEARLKFVAGRTSLLMVRERSSAHRKSFAAYRFARDRHTGLFTEKPLKDGINDHCCDAAGYLVARIDRDAPGILGKLAY